MSVWAAFTATVVRFATPEGSSLELRPGPPGVAKGRFLGEGLGLDRVHVVTAWEPGGRPSRPGANVAAQRGLEADLDELGLTWFPCVGLDPAGPHFECGAALGGLTDAEAAGLGSAYGQLAIFAWTPARWSILPCGPGDAVHQGWKTSQD